LRIPNANILSNINVKWTRKDDYDNLHGANYAIEYSDPLNKTNTEYAEHTN